MVLLLIGLTVLQIRLVPDALGFVSPLIFVVLLAAFVVVGIVFVGLLVGAALV